MNIKADEIRRIAGSVRLMTARLMIVGANLRPWQSALNFVAYHVGLPRFRRWSVHIYRHPTFCRNWIESVALRSTRQRGNACISCRDFIQTSPPALA